MRISRMCVCGTASFCDIKLMPNNYRICRLEIQLTQRNKLMFSFQKLQLSDSQQFFQEL